jgi:pyruvate/2-oxoglutarate dehydrogenase complex dihydrolipoamide acyltransferase (E2) component
MRTVLKAKIDTMKKEHAQQTQKLSKEVQKYKGLYDSQRTVVKTMQKAMSGDVAALKAENAALKVALKREKSSATMATQLTTVNPEELHELREKLQQQESRHARSISAYMKASVHSLRMLRRTTNVISGDDDVEEENAE